jgi:hypothetical protein
VRSAASERTTAERTAAALVTGFAAAMVVAYLAARLGAAIHPLPILALSVAASAVWFLRRSPESGGLAAFAAVTVAVLAILLGFSWPHLLPVGGGSDLTHHLQLIGFIEQNWRLPHDRTAAELLGNMINYTPGSHLLAALAGWMLRADGLHAMYPLTAMAVALKAGLVFLIGWRSIDEDSLRAPAALTAVALLGLPYDYSLGSFTRWSFFAQVISETCAVAMWWALVMWDRSPGRATSLLFGLAGAAAYLAWPVWLGPPVLVAVPLIAFRRDATWASRLAHGGLALAPIAIVVALHATGRAESLAIVQSGGAAFDLSASRFGWTLLTLSGIGTAVALRRPESRTTVLMLGAVVAQTLALFAVARVSGADSPYMARKMAHFAVLPMAVLSAVALAAIARGVSRAWQPRTGSGVPASAIAWIALVAIAAASARAVTTMPRSAPVVSSEMWLAGEWLRERRASACVDYLVPSDDASYWLHHAVLGNPMRPPAGAPAPVFFYRDAVTRWIVGGGLEFAIADLRVVPREVREEIEPQARFGSIVVGKNRAGVRCRDGQ